MIIKDSKRMTAYVAMQHRRLNRSLFVYVVMKKNSDFVTKNSRSRSYVRRSGSTIFCTSVANLAVEIWNVKQT